MLPFHHKKLGPRLFSSGDLINGLVDAAKDHVDHTVIAQNTCSIPIQKAF